MIQRLTSSVAGAASSLLRRNPPPPRRPPCRPLPQLLDIIAGRKSSGASGGEVTFAGRRPTRAFLRRFTAYVEQQDSLVENLTVEEMLMYTAELARPRAEPLAGKRARVAAVLAALGLEGCRRTHIGSPLCRGVSGGQLKRANIGTALVSSPRVLFLDEPTSGLDSHAAEEVMLTVRGLAARGLTVCSTIHAPSPAVNALFDRLLVLVDGHVVYFGANGAEAVDFFGGLAPLGAQFARGGAVAEAEWITKVVVAAARGGRAAACAARFAASAGATAAAARTAELAAPAALAPAELKALKTRRPVANPWWHAARVLLKYRAPADYRSPMFWAPRVVDKAAFAFIIATLYWGVGDDTASEAGVLNASAALFMWALLPGFTAITFLPALVLERVLFIRERADGLYGPGAYLLHKLGIEFAVILPISLLFAVAVWFPLRLLGSFALFWLVYLATTAVGVALGYAVASVAPSMEIAQVAASGYVVTLLFFAGLLMRLEDVPAYWYWFSTIDFVRYSWGALMVNQFAGRPDARWPLVLYQPLDYLGLDGANKWGYLGFLSCFVAVFAAAAWAGLAFARHGRR